MSISGVWLETAGLVLCGKVEVRETGEMGPELGAEAVAVRGGGEMVGGGFVMVCMAEGVAMLVSEARGVFGRSLVVMMVCALLSLVALTAVCREVRCVTSRCHRRT